MIRELLLSVLRDKRSKIISSYYIRDSAGKFWTGIGWSKVKKSAHVIKGINAAWDYAEKTKGLGDDESLWLSVAVPPK